MDSTNLPKPQFELPQPQGTPGQETSAQQTGEKDAGQMTEQRNMEAPATAAPVPPPQAAQAATTVANPPAALGLSPSGDPVAPAASSMTTRHLAADDADLIEKEWVTKAKHIVEQTRSDPHRQNTEINKVKKDYIQKRYHKDIKLNDE